VEAITRISNTTSFAGLSLLNGSLDYLNSGVTASQITDVNVFAASFGQNDSIGVTVQVTASAELGGLFLSGNTAGAPGALLSSVSFEVQGDVGVQAFSFTSGTPLSAVAAAVNSVSDATGVQASLVSAGDPTAGLVFQTEEFGSDAFVSVRRLGNGGEFFETFDEPGGTSVARDEGVDVAGLINGNTALGDGLELRVNNPSLNISLTLDAAAAQSTAAAYSFDLRWGRLPDRPADQQPAAGGLRHPELRRQQPGNLEPGFLELDCHRW